jgi:hypothetical protein
MKLPKISKLFQPRNPFERHPAGAIEHAFTHDGVAYYCFTDQLNIPAFRAFHVLTYYREIEQGMTIERLHTNIDLAIAAIDSSKLVDASVILKKLRENSYFSLHSDGIFKLASVMFFDKKENPETYDYAYAEKKIAKWKKNPPGFFLAMPIRKLLPNLPELPENFLAYLEADDLLQQNEAIEALAKPYATQLTEFTLSYLKRRAETSLKSTKLTEL